MNTKRLFIQLLSLSGSRTVCDVGSMDGAEALSFKQALPDARVVAFEANRENYERMLQDPRLRAQGVEILHQAASDEAGLVDFHIADVDYDEASANRGESSLLAGYAKTKRVDQVEAVRLDEVLADAPAPIALWVDVEGAAHQVIEGTRGVAGKVRLIHIELDLIAYWPGEVPGDQTRALIDGLGFREVASVFYPDGPGAPGWEEQLAESAREGGRLEEYVEEASGNVIFVAEAFWEKHQAAIERRVARAKMRHRVASLLGAS